MENYKLFIIGLSVYIIMYCVFGFWLVLVHRKIQLREWNKTKNDAKKLNKLYLALINKYDEQPIANITIEQMRVEIKKFKIKNV